jgi:hypothetical protein
VNAPYGYNDAPGGHALGGGRLVRHKLALLLAESLRLLFVSNPYSTVRASFQRQLSDARDDGAAGQGVLVAPPITIWRSKIAIKTRTKTKTRTTTTKR